ncbi:MAG: hypothetical protein A3G81_14330 [Betaproteobacteria bacterium RIFCSPLOWO2_12_FULL_65_14]|nr:MAG: hypothetical protein A3G81_14330 [Betaproteobacteria bacterium RIFCSPLOWO2_12_FULL_65_14]
MQSAILRSEASEAKATEKLAPGWWRQFSGIGKPLMLGLALFAVIGGASAYVGTLILWRLAVIVRRRRRRARTSRGRSG